MQFECASNGGSNVSILVMRPMQQRVWEWAFEVESLTGLFDMTPGANAVPIIDAAKRRIFDNPNDAAEVVKQGLSDGLEAEWSGMRGMYRLFDSVRSFLVSASDAIISGGIDELPAEAE